MKISIITIVFNGETTITRAIESVLSQKNVEIEYIVIDGASQDKTIQVINPYQKQLTYFISEKDGGIYDAMNKGIKLATGEVVGILNADDFYTNSLVLSDVMAQFMDPLVDAVYGDLEYFRASRPDKVVRTYRSDNFRPAQLKKGVMPAHPTLFLRKKVYEKFGIFDTSYKIAGDFEFVVRIFKDDSLNARYLKQKMVKMQMGGVSTRGLSSFIILLNENIRACHKNGISTNYYHLLSRYPRKLLEFFFIN
ncbi:glycosyltransferase [Polynucleobacter paneuropaeus]|uniref:Glycosyltransferase n=1 Tax=Polynucleobacter paneuropaeus TaxID=2527775 RepID=A0AAE2YLP7_9BURK|nr:glycosyltransferase [Polynucleobacter paneuropaeus]MBT8591849.1 glycosyltransferase [Polynucleobacter paneuropaeus]MBT8597240.1 glycosyltransferase [Polynucleobacter paneuropaeus]MBT8599053.1 glycosyltransferase [Polynucleobacter paneuropaeus]